MRVIEAYHCDYCKKYSKNKGVITRHEKECYHNPVMRACATCKHLSNVDHRRPHMLLKYVTTTYSRPVCERGFELSPLDDSRLIGYRVDLKHHCEAWEQGDEY